MIRTNIEILCDADGCDSVFRTVAKGEDIDDESYDDIMGIAENKALASRWGIRDCNHLCPVCFRRVGVVQMVATKSVQEIDE